MSDSYSPLVPAKRAYVTLLSDDSYLPGVMTLAYSIQQQNMAHDLVVLANEYLSDNTFHVLKHTGLTVHIAPKLHFSQTAQNQMVERGWPQQLTNTADKLSVLNLTEYDKLVYVDADMLVLKNIDFLFDYPHGSAAMDLGLIVNPNTNPNSHTQEQYEYLQHFNSGLFVFKPNEQDYQTCMNLLQTTVGFDQEILRILWSDWLHTPAMQLPQTCNVFATKLTEYMHQGHFGFSDVHVLHYTYQPKPWQFNQYNLQTSQDFLYFMYSEYFNKAVTYYNLSKS